MKLADEDIGRAMFRCKMDACCCNAREAGSLWPGRGLQGQSLGIIEGS